MKKVLTVFLGLTVLTSSLVACTQKSPAPSASAAATSSDAKPVSLRFSWWGADDRHKATLAVIDLFQKKNPNIKIEAEYSAIDGYAQKKTTEFASGSAPDIFQIETGLGPEYYKNGVLYNLSSTSINFGDFDPKFLAQNGQFGTGKQWAIPTGQAGSAMLVNKTLADKIGIDFSKDYTFDQLIEWGKKVQAYDPTMYLLSANSSYAMPFFVRAYARQVNGAAIINDETKTLNMTEAQFKECFEFIDKLYKNKVCAPAAYKAPFGEADQNDPNWIAGKYVAEVGYTSSVAVVSAANKNVEYMAGHMPTLANRKSDGWFNDTPQYMGMYAKTKYSAEAAKFLDFFFNDSEAADKLGTVRSVPPTNNGRKIAEQNGTLQGITSQSVKVSLLYNGQSDGGLTTGSEVTAILRDAYDNVSYGTKSPADVAKNTVNLINDFLKTNKK